MRMNKYFRDGETQAYAVLLESLWDKGLLSGYSSLKSAAECLLGGFLLSDQIGEVLEYLFKPLEPPSEDGWYLVNLETPSGQEERKLYYCYRYVRGSDPWWKGFLKYGDTPVKHEIGINDGEKVIDWSKVSSGDRVGSKSYLDGVDGWISGEIFPRISGEYLVVGPSEDTGKLKVDIHSYSIKKSKWWSLETSFAASRLTKVQYWRPLPELPEDQ